MVLVKHQGCMTLFFSKENFTCEDQIALHRTLRYHFNIGKKPKIRCSCDFKVILSNWSIIV